MRFIKKLDIYILKGHLQLFAGTFFVCLFIFLMQWVWRYVDDLIGKGLTWDVLARFVWYSALTLIPISLPLAVLLACLISFGNMGEKFELLSMKAAGVPLVRILRPVFIMALLACGVSFYFQNKVGPEATKKLYSLLYSMRTKSPELEIPEGIFYGDIPGYNLYVEHKDTRTGMLYGVMIYTNRGGFQDTEIVLADSARMQSTADKMFLKLTLYDGERFRNMDSKSGTMLRANVPYMRESFIMEEDYIPFDGNLNIVDGDLFSREANTKGLKEVLLTIGHLRHTADSTGHAIHTLLMDGCLSRRLPVGLADSARIAREVQDGPPLDTLYARLTDEQQQAAWRSAVTYAESASAEFSFRSDMSTRDTNFYLRKHKMEAHKKFTLSLACLLFFFIGAPLGAIIRKGGLGVPVVISVIIFIFYYMINAAGENNAKVMAWDITFGIWLSSSILLPVGVFLTYKANKDSVVFNIEGYQNFFRAVLGLRVSRKLNRKEVIIHDPDYARLLVDLGQLSDDCRRYSSHAHLRRIPSYGQLFFRSVEDSEASRISDQLEALVEEMHNSRDNVILARINEYPILAPDAHTRPFRGAKLGMAAGLCLPVGLLLFLRVWRYRLRLWHDMQVIQKTNQLIIDRITKQQYAQPTGTEPN